DPSKFDLQALIDFLGTIGDSIVAIKSDSIVKIHVHTKEPWKAIKYAQQYGEFVTFKMENMSIQHNEVLLKDEAEEFQEAPREHRPVAVVTVSPSKEIGELFSQLVDAISITGGQTMNPSTEDFLNAFEKANADTIIVFPNNSNVILTAEQAAQMAEGKDIRVIKTKSVIQCYSALTMADFDNGSIEDNINMFNDVSSSVVDIAIAPAVRDSQLNGVAIKEGSFMGILNHNIVYSNADIIETAVGTVGSVEGVNMSEVLTVFYGADATDPMKADFRRKVSEKFPNLEICEVEGNQPVYPFLIAVE
ncbi:MAG: hypothetical protein MJ239_06755, partial [Bacilli bacterium]|nr:hypothetical protein [Bacilli bacterium]